MSGIPEKNNNREIKHHVVRQTSACTRFPLLFLQSLNKSIRKIENNSHVHDKRETTLFDLQTEKVGFLPFAGKTNVMPL